MLVGMVAAYYLDCIAEDIRERLRARKARGRYPGGPPYGGSGERSWIPKGARARGRTGQQLPCQSFPCPPMKDSFRFGPSVRTGAR